jgi:hypothetical protein
VRGGYNSYGSLSSSPYTIRVVADYMDARSLSTSHRHDHMRGSPSLARIRRGERECSSGMTRMIERKEDEGKEKWP